ncbi:putative ribonuclease H1/H2 small subunit [Trypanosoma rangeli]|uniref:Putative ribonuclease H1/H2 small subunit n=1 Tax=Trypanosoma rangeli TaxID=5698 RepID=A0A3R7MWX3_TRYRA|nr:putative ribonuclease H1/H2 small subunit [Trypanosoma rangeli]RNF09302.1 putative ribonuclease H1/H2 small subunit [Trypanosoma rangeli]|eukprot:RNF09302.1 putative ribonuclease H1/H2 small subunit [Trypanosoma rangeli]
MATGGDQQARPASLAAVHSLPVKTTFRGTTDVVENFSRHIVRTEGGELRNRLRGRTLIGREVILPPSYVLACVSFVPRRQQQQQGTEAAGRLAFSAPPSAQMEASAADVRVTATADSLCVWEHDKPPERAEALGHWLELSHAIHCAP